MANCLKTNPPYFENFQISSYAWFATKSCDFGQTSITNVY